MTPRATSADASPDDPGSNDPGSSKPGSSKPGSSKPPQPTAAGRPTPAFLGRCAFGGILMGLANLVPGISGGTMLLAAGVYPPFIAGVAEVSTFRFRLPTLLTLGTVIIGALLAIVGLAGPVRDLVVEHRWIMYALFIGLTLGGVPILWRMVRPLQLPTVVGAVAGLAGMVALVWSEGQGSGDSSGGSGWLILGLAGIAGGSAMILPGVSGGYLLLVLGQYIVILDAIDAAKTGVSARDWTAVGTAMQVFVPVGIGVVVGVVGVSNLVAMLLARFRLATLGVLLGLLIGAVIGLWPFQEGVAPQVGDVIRGVELLTPEQAAEVDPKYWATQVFRPTGGQVVGAVVLVAFGFLGSLLASLPGRGSAQP